MMTRRMWFRRLVVLVGAVTLGAIGLAAASSERSDCPGKIVCPITGKPVCKDQCPARDANRSDCPGQIVCPQTGKLVCRDRCRLIANGQEASGHASKPAGSCCKKGA